MKESSIDRERFVALVQQHRGILFRVVRGYCRDSSEHTDLVQEIVLQLWRSRHADMGRLEPSTWVYRIALNVAISAYRRQRTRQKFLVRGSTPLLEVVADEQPPAEGFEPAIDKLHDFIHRLDPLHRAILTLYLDGLSHRRIADVVGISESNVGTKLGRLKTRLERHFERFPKPE